MSSKKSKGKRMKGTTIAGLSDGTALLPGRRECCCEASKHELVANCLSCGRVVCAQEGYGNCFTCGKLVLTRAQRQTLLADNNQSKELLKELLSNGVTDELLSESGLKPNRSESNGQQPNAGLRDIAASLETRRGLENAVRHKQQMLEFDSNSSVRTRVIDDEMDYFSVGSQNWISNEKRKILSAKAEELHENKYKKNTKILIDLIEHSATDYSEPVIKNFEEKVEELYSESQLKTDYESVEASDLIDEDVGDKRKPFLVYLKNDCKVNDRMVEDLNVSQRLINSCNNLRIQDKELMTMSDEGMCLSVNQPFASLLVSGIKRFEGRNWYSAFRGRLWIHSNSKQPNEEYVTQVEAVFRFAGVTTFPASYPTSALLGCVSVTDCLPFDEYRVRYPDGDTEANYILVCEDPKPLSKPFPISSVGNRIYKLNQSIHFAAQKALIL